MRMCLLPSTLFDFQGSWGSASFVEAFIVVRRAARTDVVMVPGPIPVAARLIAIGLANDLLGVALPDLLAHFLLNVAADLLVPFQLLIVSARVPSHDVATLRNCRWPAGCW